MRNTSIMALNLSAVGVMLWLRRASTLAIMEPIAKPPSPVSLIEHSSFQNNPYRNAWGVLVPEIWEETHYIDVTVHWSVDEGCLAAAEKCVDAVEQQLTSRKRQHFSRNVIKECIASSMESFVTFCSLHLRPNAFKARLVCGRSATSARCPRWHVDQVPLRYIQSFIGPGCQYVECAGLLESLALLPSEQELEGGMGDFDTSSSLHDYVNRIAQRHPESVHLVPEGDAAILIGNEWPDHTLKPCVHKSPSGLMPWDGRVLFTIDVM